MLVYATNSVSSNAAMGSALENIVLKKMIPISIIAFFVGSFLHEGVTAYMMPAVIMGFASVLFFALVFFVLNSFSI